jgi:FKBP-type peptidyl-prolyl cis-trans isomerase 2
MAAIKEKDFVEIEYTGRIKEENIVFDTTDEKTAKNSDIYNEQMPYGPVSVCVGSGSILKGLEDNLVGKEPEKSYRVELSPENAFGKKNAKMLKIVNTNVFRKSNINPVPGLQVNIDGIPGTIKSITGGRTVVDFNHPLSGKNLVYEVKINRIITDEKEKIKSLIIMGFNLKPDSFTVNIDADRKAELEFKEGIKLKHFNTAQMTESLKEMVGVKEVVYKEAGAKEQKTAAEPKPAE